MSEAIITKATRDLLNQYKSNKLPIYFNKISDRFTSGIPDWQGTFFGISFYIELKDKGEQVRPLQEWHLNEARKAGAEVLATDNFDDVVVFMERIRVNHEHIARTRYS